MFKKKKTEEEIESMPEIIIPLPKALKFAVNALEKDTVWYDWNDQESCNCGIVVQALLNKSCKQVEELFHQAIDEVPYKLEENTWRNIAKFSCSITGIPLTDVFKLLYDHGLKAEDIVHLEYLNNPVILKISKIDSTKKEYYQSKENLILYLKAWTSILEHNFNIDELSDKFLLEAKLLIATNQEDYQEAARLRNQLAIL